jgi:teichuronic acid biosynthesis glycosyltransferase TuaC
MRQLIKVLFVTHMFPSCLVPHQGIFLLREAEYLKQCGIESHFLIPIPYCPWPIHDHPRWRRYGPKNQLLSSHGASALQRRYLSLPGRWFRLFEGRAMAYALFRTSVKLHRIHRYDVIFGVPMEGASEAAVMIGKTLGVPTAAMAIGSDVMVWPSKVPLMRSRLARTIARADLLVGVCDAICERLESLGSPRSKPIRVYLGRDTTLFSPAGNKGALRAELGLAPSSVIGVFVGHVAASKGIVELARAAEALGADHPDFCLLCIGDGDAVSQLRGVNRRAQREVIRVCGSLPPKGVAAHLQAADFFILPSRSEGMPQALLEAMNCGLPAIGTRVGGISEALVDHETGLLVAPGDEAELRRALARMIVDAPFRTRAGCQARLLAAQKFDPISNAETLADHLRSLRQR